MKIAYLDCFSGVSGDMLLGAFVDLGLPLEQLTGGLASLGLDREFSLQTSKTEKCGIYGTKLDVILKETNHNGHHDHDHDHNHHNRHHHRHLGDIVATISRSELDDWVKEKSIEIFNKLAAAEGKIHNQPADKVHFHEVGAVDSIVDVVGTVLSVRLLEIECIYSSPLPIGRGFVKTAHGVVPLPAPATAELIRGLPVYWVDSHKELVTPTGAAILSVLVEEFGGFPPMCLEGVGYGCGTQNRKVPNMLRIFTGWL